MIDSIVKLLIVIFAFAVGSCFTFWPQEVGQRFDRWRRRSVNSGAHRGTDIIKRTEAIWLRQIGMFLIGLTCYFVYLWLSG